MMRGATTFAPVALDQDLAKRITRASEKLQRDREERERLILFAYAQGASLRDIAEAAGMNHVGVKKLVERIEPDYVVRDKDGNVLAIIECKSNPPRDFDPSDLERVIKMPHHRDMPGAARKR